VASPAEPLTDNLQRRQLDEWVFSTDAVMWVTTRCWRL
jgi:hypothetical protein